VSELARRERFPTAHAVAADPDSDESVHPALQLPRLLALSRARLRWVSDQLGEQIEAQGLRGVVDQRWGINAAGDAVQLGEDVRALVILEERERDRCASLAERIARLGLQAREGSAAGSGESRRLAAVLEEFARQLGADWSDHATRLAAQRAIVNVKEREVAAAAGRA
jgi:hypothetical protein